LVTIYFFTMLTKEETKKLAALHAISMVEKDMVIGIGTGSTVYWFIQELAILCRQGLPFTGVPTSMATTELAKSLGIPMINLNDTNSIDLTVDGADEIDAALHLIKGGGGALLQEKMVAAASAALVIIADSSKYVTALGAFPLPVEVIPYGWKQVQRQLQATYQIETVLRMKDNRIFITDHGHHILDCHFKHIEQPAALEQAINMVPGVVENGLFIHRASCAIIASPNGSIQKITPHP
jgi:ribose 5-phosphate isomerase A